MTATELKSYILEQGLVAEILKALGCWNIKEYANYISASNPDGDNPNAIICYTDTNYLKTINYTRDIKGDYSDIITLVQYVKKCDFIFAVKWLHEQVGLAFSYYKQPSVVKKENPFMRLLKLKSNKNRTDAPKPIDEAILGEFTAIEWEGLFREGVTPKTCKKFGVMYSYKWKRIIYPHRYALDGSLLAYNARTTIANWEEFGVPKFYLTPGYRKSDNIYGLWENRKAIEKCGMCIVVESEKSVLKRHSLFDERFVSLSGHTISEEQVRLLAGLNIQEVVISFDNDIPEIQVWDVCEKIHMFKVVSYTTNIDGLLGPKDSIADLSDVNCRKIIERRKRYDTVVRNRYKTEIMKRRIRHEIDR